MSDPESLRRNGAPGPLPEGAPHYLLSEDGFPVFAPDPVHWTGPFFLAPDEKERLRHSWDHLSRTVEEMYDCGARLRVPGALEAPAGGDSPADARPEREPPYLQNESGFPVFVADLGHWCLPLSLPGGEQERLRRAWDQLLKTADDPYGCEERLKPVLLGSLQPSKSPTPHPQTCASAPPGDAGAGRSCIRPAPEPDRAWVIDKDGLAWPSRPVFVEWEEPGEVIPDDAVRISVIDTGGGLRRRRFCPGVHSPKLRGRLRRLPAPSAHGS